MKLILASLLSYSLSYASLDTIESFQANFIQSVIDDKNATLQYSGNVAAEKQKNVVWHYLLPVQKDVYIDTYRVVIVEPEIEQVIIRKIQKKFDFFHMINNAKKIAQNKYETYYKEVKYTITMEKELIKSISYKDSFENDVNIVFSKQKQNIKIDEEVFVVKYSAEFDVITD